MDNYTLSNNLNLPKCKIGKKAKTLYNKIREGKQANQKDLQELCNNLCDCFDLKHIPVSYSGKQLGNGKRKTLGHYRTTDKIKVYKYTAVQNKEVASKTVVAVLIHEFMHYLETRAMNLKSIHSKGFYNRINELTKKLGGNDD